MSLKYGCQLFLALLSGIACAAGALYAEQYFSLDAEHGNGDYFIVFFDNFFLISLIEELSKFVMVFLFLKFIHNRKILLYIALCIGLGFSIFEMSLYTYYQNYDIYRWIPFALHIFLAIIQMRVMMYALDFSTQRYFYINLAWVITWLIHGVYDLSVSISIKWIWIFSLLTVLFLVSLYILFSQQTAKDVALETKIDEEENESGDFGFFK
ncbi:MAG: PrsW family glutamic-type intramembrane protease [Bacteroidota bacterium]|nr:PrsW family glutamic-type intramembrane protease [Bacteroidota bacterium]